MRLGWLDATILVAYLVITTFIGFWVGRKEKATTKDYFLAGSRVPWYAIGFSMVASSISTEQFIGEVGFAYQHGLAVANWEWLNFPALTVLIWIFTPFYIRGNVTTMPEFLERRYGVVPRTIFAVLTVVSYAMVNLALVLYGGAVAINYIFGIPMMTCVIGLAVVTGAYTIYGGLSAVVWTDVFQCVLLLIGGMLIFGIGLYKVDGGWEVIRSTGDRAHLVLPASDPNLPWTAMIALALSTNVWYFCSNQYINQRCLAAKDEWHAKMGIVFCGFIGIILALCVTFPGLIAHALNPSIEDPNQVYPYLITHILPPSLQGLLLAALISAIMSTISSLVNSTATVFTLDIYQRFLFREVTDAHLIRIGRFAGAAVLLIGVACTPLVGLWQSIFSYCQEIWVLLAGPTVAVFVVGILWRRASNAAASVIMALSFPLAAVPFVQRLHPFLPAAIENIYVFGLLVLLACVVLMVVISLFTRPEQRDSARALHWTPAMLRLPDSVMASKPHWYQSVGLWWGLMVSAFVVIYAVLW